MCQVLFILPPFPTCPWGLSSGTCLRPSLSSNFWLHSHGGRPGSRLEGPEGKGRRGLLTLNFLSQERGFPGGSDSTKTRRAKSLQVMSDSETLWTLACQAPLSMGFSRQEYWRGLPCCPPGDLPNPISYACRHWQAGSLPLVPPGKL